MKKIAIFASGSGTNAENIMQYFEAKKSVQVCRIYSNKQDAYVLTRARKFNVPTLTFNRNEFLHSDKVLDQLIKDNTDLIVLAGFLWLVPKNILENYTHRIINIHPALLPNYGGKGMYGRFVHEAVIHAGDRESGISIHYVNDRYDEGEIIFQARCRVTEEDTPESLAAKIHVLEYEHYPRIIEDIIKT
jgi:phosphoribosylglycinamide formyltransferase-1